ncbi:MAG: IclR family transcriptional regulator [Chloroflexi bacterium]|nr:IclR family transcriptional regulator [Chloroflexota bacterium]
MTTVDRAINGSARSRTMRLSETVGKGVAILDVLAHEPYDLTISEVAAAVGLDRTTAYRLLETLVEARLLVRDPQSRRYRLGLRLLDYANAVRDRLEVRHVALSHLLDLQQELDAQPALSRATMVALLDNVEVVLVEVLGISAPRTDLTRRTRIPAHISASGRCLLAHLDAEDLTARLKSIYADGPSGDGFHTREWVERELEAIRERGYGVSDREVGSNTRALAVPVLARSGAPLAAVGIVVRPTTTTLEELVDRYAAPMLSIAERISVALRYRS